MPVDNVLYCLLIDRYRKSKHQSDRIIRISLLQNNDLTEHSEPHKDIIHSL